MLTRSCTSCSSSAHVCEAATCAEGYDSFDVDHGRCLAREALLLRQLRYSTGQRAPACFYTPYRAYLAAAGTRTYAPPPPQPRGAPSAAASPARRGAERLNNLPFFESPESPRQRMKPWPGYRCAGRESGPLLYTNSVICISEIHSEFSDSIQFMQIHTEFRYDAPQDRRACEGA